MTSIYLYRVSFTPDQKGLIRRVDFHVVAENRTEAIDIALKETMTMPVMEGNNTVETEVLLSGFRDDKK